MINKFCFTDNEIKAINTLYGLVMGILADQHLDDREILFLDTWIKDHDPYTKSFPLNVVKDRLANVLADNIITAEERQHLHDTLSSLMGGTVEETGAAGGLPTALPVNEVVAIIPGSTICFTGEFAYGTRSKCEQAALMMGLVPVKSITAKLDYLVIGVLSNANWITAGHGRKIEKALHLQGKGCPVKIMPEETWLTFLN